MDLIKSSLDVILQIVSWLLMFTIIGSVFVISLIYLNPKAREFKRYFGLYPDRHCGPAKANEILRKKFSEIFSEEISFEELADLEGVNKFLEEEVNGDLQNEWETVLRMAQLAEENGYPLDDQNQKHLAHIKKLINVFVMPAA